MIEIEARVDDRLVREMALFDKGIKKEIKKVEKEVLKQGKKELTEQIKKRYMKPKVSGRELKVKGNEIVAEGRLLTIGDTHFSATPRGYKPQEGIKVSKRKSLKVTIKKGHKTTFKHAFIANPESIKGGHAIIWEKTGKKEKRKVPNRKKEQWVHLISPIKTVAVPEMANTLADDVVDKMYRRYDAKLKKYVERK